MNHADVQQIRYPCQFTRILLGDLPKTPSGIFFANKSMEKWFLNLKIPNYRLKRLRDFVFSKYSASTERCHIDKAIK